MILKLGHPIPGAGSEYLIPVTEIPPHVTRIDIAAQDGAVVITARINLRALADDAVDSGDEVKVDGAEGDARIADGAQDSTDVFTIVGVHQPVCPHCHSADFLERRDDGWYCLRQTKKPCWGGPGKEPQSSIFFKDGRPNKRVTYQAAEATVDELRRHLPLRPRES